MGLPNSHNALIPTEKLTKYLLSQDHPIGRWKAKFLRSIGFDETNLDVLKDALRSIAENGTIKDTMRTDFGTKYIIEGQITPPHGHVVILCTVWVMEHGEDPPRFVTAYPA